MNNLTVAVLQGIRRVFKSALLVLAALVGLVVVLIAASQLNEYYYVTLPSRQVTVFQFQVKSKLCSGNDYPLLVAFKNGSSRKVLAINFSFEAYYPGHSTDLAKYNSQTDDMIKKPGEITGNCYRYPEFEYDSIKPSDVEFHLRIESVRFAE